MKLEVAKELLAGKVSSIPFVWDEEESVKFGEAVRLLLQDRFEKARKANQPLEVVMDDITGYDFSFIDASFVKFAKANAGKVTRDNFIIDGKDPAYYWMKGILWRFMEEGMEACR